MFCRQAVRLPGVAGQHVLVQVGLGLLDVLTCLGFVLNQGPAMLESIPFIVAPRLVLDGFELLPSRYSW